MRTLELLTSTDALIGPIRKLSVFLNRRSGLHFVSSRRDVVFLSRVKTVRVAAWLANVTRPIREVFKYKYSVTLLQFMFPVCVL